MNYEFILLDADGTLFDFKAAERQAFRGLFQQFGIAYEEKFLPVYQEINDALWNQLEAGAVTKEELQSLRFERLLKALQIEGYTGSQWNAGYIELLGGGSQLLPGALELCQGLHGKCTLLIATNGVARSQTKRLNNSPLKQYIDYMAISETAGFSKPDRRYFDYAFQMAGNPSKEKAVILGDSLSADILGGAAYSIATCWYNPGGKELPQDFPVQPHYEIRRLTDFLGIVGV